MGLNDFFRKGKEEPVPEKETTEENITPEPIPEPTVHVVQAGESLSRIAKEHYGDAMKWKIIYEANADKIANPDIIHPGEEFIIPNIQES